MVISKAARDEYESVRSFYHSMIDALEGTKYHPKWQKDIYPAQEEWILSCLSWCCDRCP